MTIENNIESNPGTSTQDSVSDEVFGSEDNFFGKLEDSVNGMVQDNPNITPAPTKATQNLSGSGQVTHESTAGSNKVNAWDSEGNPYKKRYKDSSKEAIKMATQLKQLEPFMPILDAMKKDSGLVDHVRGYLESGGAPAPDIKQQLKLRDDFQFNANEAYADSAKVMSAHLDRLVSSRVGTLLNQEKENSKRIQGELLRKKQEQDFRTKYAMTDEQFNSMVGEAKSRKLTLDDIYYLLNKDKAASNAVNASKQEMLAQMKSVRDIPTSASDSNSQGENKNQSDSLFDGMLGLDGDVDNLFG